MTLLAGLLAIGVALLGIYMVVWVRWRVRDRQRRRQRMAEREQARDELERTRRQLRLRVFACKDPEAAWIADLASEGRGD